MKANTQIRFNTKPYDGEKNEPFTAEEIREWRESRNGKRDTLLNTEPNRRARRLKSFTKPVNNNRAETKARKGNKLYLKMAKFSLKMLSLIGR